MRKKVELINLKPGEKFQDEVQGTIFTGEVIGYTEDGMVYVTVGGIATTQPPRKKVFRMKEDISDIELIKLCLQRGINPKIKLKHRGMKGTYSYDNQSHTLWGKLKNIKGLVTFESVDGTIISLIQEFKSAVDDYLNDLSEFEWEKRNE